MCLSCTLATSCWLCAHLPFAVTRTQVFVSGSALKLQLAVAASVAVPTISAALVASKPTAPVLDIPAACQADSPPAADPLRGLT